MNEIKIELSNRDDITYELISEIIIKHFTRDGKSFLKGADYRINDKDRVWFINFAARDRINEMIRKEKYAIYPSDDTEKIFLFNETGSEENILKRFNNFKNKDDYIIVFAKFKDNSFYKGYKFLGVYKLDGMVENNPANMVFKKVENTYLLTNSK
ncbi:hypothetical protein [Spiroplasma monobiae]|uniref:PvuRts1 I-like SET and RING associated domain-containing protein n=1 Tax=Spiroplasma monobiae MQ-1 TaxID=1336748 RepID=A0A2K9LVJ8_SPISQ|nr:hypothetical protein [Spiroplasma monobiae]AUM63059.1 hypothetical protein SMONO_v1c08100 [Spiroplasma monobiae MQ-1]